MTCDSLLSRNIGFRDQSSVRGISWRHSDFLWQWGAVANSPFSGSISFIFRIRECSADVPSQAKISACRRCYNEPVMHDVKQWERLWLLYNTTAALTDVRRRLNLAIMVLLYMMLSLLTRCRGPKESIDRWGHVFTNHGRYTDMAWLLGSLVSNCNSNCPGNKSTLTPSNMCDLYQYRVKTVRKFPRYLAIVSGLHQPFQSISVIVGVANGNGNIFRKWDGGFSDRFIGNVFVR